MDAFDRLGTVCLVLSCIIVLPLLYYLRHNFLLMVLLGISALPIFWIAGLNILEFLTKPFNEKGMKGLMSWIIVILLGIVLYSIFFVGLRYMLVFLMILR